MKRRGRPRIGITPDVSVSVNAKEPVTILQERYARAVEQAGGVPLILPPLPSSRTLRAMIEALDGLVVSGGNFDIHPKFYGEKPIAGLGAIKEERTEFELGMIALALARDMPLLGICGGAQAINVALGGSLYQDIDTQHPNRIEHQRSQLKDCGGHAVAIYAGTKLRKIVGKPTLEVNTTHHQAVKTPGKKLIVNATAEDGVIEGIESAAHRFVLGVQWHPEFLVHRDAAQRKIFAALVRTCK
jgi:putative glutamine amidotransferase